MARIAVIFEGRVQARYGVFNAVLNRVRHLREILPEGWTLDVFMLQLGANRLKRCLARQKSAALDDGRDITVDGETLHVIGHDRSLLDAVRHRLGREPLDYIRYCRKVVAPKLSNYDILSAHDLLPAVAAREAAKYSGARLFVTWHGSSINTDPWHDAMVKRLTAAVLAAATCNFTVSDAMASVARALCPACSTMTLHNGATPDFHRYDNQQLAQWRRQMGLRPGQRVVAFVGRLVEGKNVMLLPEIAAKIEQQAGMAVTLWVVGDGPLYGELQRRLAATPLDWRMWGAVDPGDMPRLMSCADLLVLPSIMEGLPLVAVEALSCGTAVVATRVGGCAEVIGDEWCVNVDSDIPTGMARLAARLLRGEATAAPLPPSFDWHATALKELSCYNETK